MEVQRITISSEDRSLLSLFMGEDPGNTIDFNYLMPVVEKIGRLYEDAFPKGDEFIKRILAHKDPIDKEYIDVISTSICTPISEVYEIVVTFIKWYQNEQV